MKRNYNYLDLLGMVGGLSYIAVLVLSQLIGPFARGLFQIFAIEQLYKVKGKGWEFSQHVEPSQRRKEKE